jgi:hypothetical protein
MKRLLFVPALLLPALLLNAPVALAQSPEGTATPAPDAQAALKAEFTARYGQLRAALIAKDAPAAKALLTKDFELIDQRGTSTADEMIEEMGRMGGRMGGGGPMGGPPPGAMGNPPPGAMGGPPPGAMASPPPAPMSGQPQGASPPQGMAPPKTELTIDTLEVTGSTAKLASRSHASGSRKGPDGLEHSFEMTRITDDVWQRKGDQWLLRSISLREMIMKRDGKEVFHVGG